MLLQSAAQTLGTVLTRWSKSISIIFKSSWRMLTYLSRDDDFTSWKLVSAGRPCSSLISSSKPARGSGLLYRLIKPTLQHQQQILSPWKGGLPTPLQPKALMDSQQKISRKVARANQPALSTRLQLAASIQPQMWLQRAGWLGCCALICGCTGVAPCHLHCRGILSQTALLGEDSHELREE